MDGGHLQELKKQNIYSALTITNRYRLSTPEMLREQKPVTPISVEKIPISIILMLVSAAQLGEELISTSHSSLVVVDYCT